MINIEHKLWTAPGRRPNKTAPMAVYTSSILINFGLFHATILHVKKLIFVIAEI